MMFKHFLSTNFSHRASAVIAAATILAASVPAPAFAAYLVTTTYLEPTGTVEADESIPVWIRFALDLDSDPLNLHNDPTAYPPFGAPYENYNIVPNWAQAKEWTRLVLIAGPLCGNTFAPTFGGSCTDVLTGLPMEGTDLYDFEAGNILIFDSSRDASLTMLPGESRDIWLGTFHPRNGSAPPGEYSLGVRPILRLTGIAEASGPEAQVIGATRLFNSPHGFVLRRTVTPVPVPAVGSAAGLALAALLLSARRRY